MEVKNVNDNVPLTKAPVYYPRVKEDAAPNTPIIQLEATDADISDTRITYKITTGNPQSLFTISANTGERLKSFLVFCEIHYQNERVNS